MRCKSCFGSGGNMFVRLKNGMLYGVFSNGISDYIFTHDVNKAGPDFQLVRDKYRKEIDLGSEDIEECFEAVFKVKFDVGIPGAKDIWVVERDSDIPNNKLVLWGGSGDGWVSVENGVSFKEFDFRDAQAQFMEKLVFSRDGKKYARPKRVVTELTKEEFGKAVELYDERNA